MIQALQRMVTNDEGQDLVEYALIIAFVAILIVASLTALKDGISSAISRVADCLSSGTCP